MDTEDVEPASINELAERVHAENEKLLGTLQTLGKAPSIALFTDVTVQTLVNLVAPEGTPDREKFDLARELAIHHQLVLAVEQFSGPKLFVPTDGGAT